MADSEVPWRIQSVEEIHTVKSANGDAFKRELALSEKAPDVSIEERAIRIANQDLNHKHKQVSSQDHCYILCKANSSKTYTGWMLMWLAYQSSLNSIFPSYITQTNLVNRYRSHLRRHWNESSIRLFFDLHFAAII